MILFPTMKLFVMCNPDGSMELLYIRRTLVRILSFHFPFLASIVTSNLIIMTSPVPFLANLTIAVSGRLSNGKVHGK